MSDRIVLAIDPGIGRCGVAVARVESGKLDLLAADTFETAVRSDLQQRMSSLWRQLSAWIDQYHPNEIAVEQLFASNQLRTVVMVAEVRGMLRSLSFVHGMKWFEYSPAQVKSAVAGTARATKGQVKKMTVELLKLENNPKIDDTADALAVLVTHVLSTARQLL